SARCGHSPVARFDARWDRGRSRPEQSRRLAAETSCRGVLGKSPLNASLGLDRRQRHEAVVADEQPEVHVGQVTKLKPALEDRLAGCIGHADRLRIVLTVRGEGMFGLWREA